MPENPYQTPSGGRRGPNRIWPWLCIAGLGGMLAAGVALCGSGSVHNGGVTFLDARMALVLAAMFCLGALGFITGTIGWLISLVMRRREPLDAD